MKKLFNLKKAGAIGAVVALFASLGLTFVSQANAYGNVAIESNLTVANGTAGDTSYKDAVNAKIDDVVKFSIYLHNKELAESGKVGNNVNVKINIPNTFTKSHVATSTVGGTNTNTVSDTATVNTEINSTLEYIPGTAYRKYNNGNNTTQSWVTEKISDNVVAGGYVIPALQPCCNFQETITVQARLKAPVFTVDKFVKIEGSNQWVRTVTANPGDKLAYMLAVKNVSNVNLTNLLIQDSFPPKLDYVEGSAVLTNSSHPNGMKASDNLINGGTYVGSYGPGAAAYVRYNAIVPKDLSDGCWKFDNVVNVKADQTGWVNNNAITTVCYKKSIPTTTTTVTTTTVPKVTTTTIPGVTTTVAPTQLPVSGPAEAAAAFGTFSISGAILSYLRTKKNLIDSIFKR